MMAFIDKLVAGWKKDVQEMKDQIEWMESTDFQSGPGPQSPGVERVNTTPDAIARYKLTIAKLEGLIARHPEAK
jgi:hypothetical protein